MRMKIAVLAILIASGFMALAFENVNAADGQQIFNANGCVACHKPDSKTVGPGLKEIAGAYGTPDALVEFFKSGHGKLQEPVPAQMKAQLPRLQKLPDDDKKALAQYMMTFK